MVVATPVTTGPTTARAPAMAPATPVLPASCCTAMLSPTTMASSTTMPVTSTSVSSVMELMVSPRGSNIRMPPRKATGMPERDPGREAQVKDEDEEREHQRDAKHRIGDHSARHECRTRSLPSSQETTSMPSGELDLGGGSHDRLLPPPPPVDLAGVGFPHPQEHGGAPVDPADQLVVREAVVESSPHRPGASMLPSGRVSTAMSAKLGRLLTPWHVVRINTPPASGPQLA